MTQHTAGCRRVFKRYDPQCPRCQQLIDGAAPHKGWGDHAARQEANRSRWLREHNCTTSNCGPVCTFGDW